MKAVVDYLKEPSTIWKIIVGIFALGIMRATVNSQINTLEQKVDKIESLDLQTKLSRIETDIAWIKQALESKIK